MAAEVISLNMNQILSPLVSDALALTSKALTTVSRPHII